MIIRVNFKDNDYSKYFEEFFENFSIVNYYANINYLRDKADKDSIKMYVDKRIRMEDLYNKVFYMPEKLTSVEKRKFAKYVKESIIAYFSNKFKPDTLHYIDEATTVTLLKTYTDMWENDESIYYFTNKNISILQ